MFIDIAYIIIIPVLTWLMIGISIFCYALKHVHPELYKLLYSPGKVYRRNNGLYMNGGYVVNISNLLWDIVLLIILWPFIVISNIYKITINMIIGGINKFKRKRGITFGSKNK